MADGFSSAPGGNYVVAGAGSGLQEGRIYDRVSAYEYIPMWMAGPSASGVTALGPDATAKATGVNPTETSYSLYGHTVPLIVLGGRIGGEIIAGPWIENGLASFCISFGVPANLSGTRDIREIAFDSEVVWDTAGASGVTTSAGGTFGPEPFTFRFYAGTLTQGADALETSHFGADAVAYRPQILLWFENLPIANTKFQKIPYVSAVIGDSSGSTITLGDAFEQLAASPWVKLADFETTGVTDEVRGLIITQQMEFLQLIQQFGRVYRNLDILQTDKLRVVDRGSNVTADINLDRSSLMGAVTLARAEPNSIPRKLTLSTIDADADYTIVPSEAAFPQDPVNVSASTREEKIYLPAIIPSSTRQSIVTFAKYQEEVARKKISGTAMAYGLEIEPGDLVGISGLGDDFPGGEVFKVTETLHGVNYTVEFTAESIMSCDNATIADGPCTESGHAARFLARTSGLDATHANAYTALLNGIEADALTCKLDFLYVFATQDSTTAKLNLIQNNYNCVAHGTPTFTADQGFSGVDGSTTIYLATGFNPTVESATSQMQQNDGHISEWSLTNATSVHAAFGAADGITNTYIFPKYTDNNAYFRVNTGSAGGAFANATPTGHYIGTRTGFTRNGYRNGSDITGSYFETSLPLNNVEFYAAAGNSSGTADGSGLLIAAISAGAYLDATESANLYARLRTYMTAVGVP